MRARHVDVTSEGEVAVGILEDRVVIREGLRSLLVKMPGIRTAWSTSSIDEASAHAESLRVDAILIGTDIPGAPVPRVVALLKRGRNTATRMIGVVAGPFGRADLGRRLDALDHVIHVSASLEEFTATMVRDDRRPDLPRRAPDEARSETRVSLTPREQDVLLMLASAEPNKSIAVALGISEATVKRHAGSIFSKFCVSSRGQAVLAARRAGVIF